MFSTSIALSANSDLQGYRGVLPEADEISWISDILLQHIDSYFEIESFLYSENPLLTEIPSIWPVKDGEGRIIMYFGQNIHPLFGHYYFHRGINIATPRSGNPIIATADGEVITAEFNTGLGNFIVIRHKHGFYTRYAHLRDFAVEVGQQVSQGEVIGYLGNTGWSTGPQLHYEVRIGSGIVNPIGYSSFRNILERILN